jgi:ABC-type Fe3+/spermidine/putrescine transport system ATPase subunit
MDGAIKVLDAIDATFFRGEYVCILGPSGCGKTAL